MELNKLIEQYERETGEKAKYECTGLMYEMTEEWTTDFVIWLVALASRPTCGHEQRKFLDRLKKDFYYNEVENGITNKGDEYDILYQDTFPDTNLKELVNE